MRFGLVHRILLDSLILLGMLALVSTGEFGRIGGATLLLALVAAALVPSHWQERKALRLFATYAPVVLIVAQLVRWITGGNPLTIAVELAALLQLIRVSTRRGAIQDQQLIALALLHLIAATVLGGGLTFALCFVGFIIVTPPALVLSHLRREVEGNYRQGARDRTGLPVDVPRILRSRRVISRGFVLFVALLSLPVFLVTTVIFVTFPRVGLSLFLLEPNRPTRLVGFSDRVDLGGVGTLNADPALALRVLYPNLPPQPPKRLALYLRGTTLDHYEDRRWSRTDPTRLPLERYGAQYPITRLPDPVRDPSFTVELEPIDPPVLFVPEHAVAIELMPHSNQVLLTPPSLFISGDRELRYARIDDRRGPKYRVYLETSPSPVQPLTAVERRKYLQLPRAVTPRLAELARQWTKDATTPLLTADRIATRLRQEYKYDLNSPSGKSANPIEDFLLVSKRGHCEFYSTAMALLLRSLGIPTRNVTGFAGATYNRYGRFYAVRQADAHSWVEVWIDGNGWRRFDPTPATATPEPSSYRRWLLSMRDFVEATAQGWNSHVERYDLRQQLRLMSAVNRGAHKARDRLTLPSGYGRHVQIAAVLLLATLAGYYLYRRRVRARSTETPVAKQSAAEIVRLYQKLDRLLLERGVPRPEATPPWTHAQSLESLGHPWAEEVKSLTSRYLEVRFGQSPFTEDEARDFAARITALRRQPPLAHPPHNFWRPGSPLRQ